MTVIGTNQSKNIVTPTGVSKSTIISGTNMFKNNVLVTYLVTDSFLRIINTNGDFICTSLTGAATNQSKS